MNIIPYIAVWVVLGFIVIVLAVSRMRLAKREDATVHVLESEREVERQKEVTRKIAKIDWWGQILTVVVVLYGIIMAGMYTYHAWQQSSKLP
jgi:ABC-type Fe3+ transport system permease subunit